MKLGIIDTSAPSWCVVHDASRPFAIVEFGRKGTVRRVISRHATMDAAKKAKRKYNETEVFT